MRKSLSLFTLIIITVFVLFFGNSYYHQKVEKSMEQSRRAMVLEAKREKAAKLAEQKAIIAEQKAVYEKHKGETLTYIPMGDSIGEGYASYDSDHRYVEVFQDTLQEKMGFDVSIEEEIVASGKGLKDHGLPKKSIIKEHQPDLVTIEFGTNDAAPDRVEAYVDPETFEEELNSLVKYIRSVSPDTKMVLVTSWKIEKYDYIIRKVGEDNEVPVADIADVWSRNDTVDPKGTQLKHSKSDGWHPNNLGHQLIAEAIYEQAYEILK